MNEILSIHDLSVNYGGIEAVKGISFDVHEGEIVTLIGANGAGKSSTLRTIAGLVKPSTFSRACASARGRRAARFPAVSSRCWLWAARSWHARSSL